MQSYDGLSPYYGDLHNHCGISYGHGGLDTALENARQQLDFCSVTGHALWPDMPEPDGQNQHIIDFHNEGFARLRDCWPEVQRTIDDYHQPGRFVTFLSFEMHSCEDGDYTILYKGGQGEILEVDGLSELRQAIDELRRQGVDVLAFPHHIGYRRGQRGINWNSFREELSPIVEIVSMHGCSEADETARPFLNEMGSSDGQSTMQHGLASGHFFGVIGSTDHHCAHPGSYDHGRTGLWATAKTREAIWEALCARRTYALTGDRIELQFAVNGAPMGSQIPPTERRRIAFHVVGGAPLDYADVVKNGRLLRRTSCNDAQKRGDPRLVQTRIHLELGWGVRGRRQEWDVLFGISNGRILAVEPRFRGPDILDPTMKERSDREQETVSGWEREDRHSVRIATVTHGNSNTRTPGTQGMCLHVEMPLDGTVRCVINGHRVDLPLKRLLAGAWADRLGAIGTAGYRLHRAPRQWEFDWSAEFEDSPGSEHSGEARSTGDVYYLRVRQLNDQWAWSSPIRVG